MKARWRAWYADGAVYSSADVAWADLPAEGMVGVVVYLAHPYRRIVDGADWYWLADGEVHALMTHKAWGQFVEAPADVPARVLKRSGVLGDEEWEGVRREMLEART